MDIRTLQGGIQERQRELHRIAELLAKSAKKNGTRTAITRAVTITLGAFVATNVVATELWGERNAFIAIVYAASGLCIAATSGLEAAFKLESRSAGLLALAASCQTTIQQIDTGWLTSVGPPELMNNDPAKEESRRNAARTLLDRQDQALMEIHAKAAELRENIPFEMKKLYGTDKRFLA